MNPQRTVSGYAELLINAVEHGNLEVSYEGKGQLIREDRWLNEIELRLNNPMYSNRTVDVLLEKTDTLCRVTVTVSDQGKGFDGQKCLDFSPERAFDLHGRGIAMSKTISFDSLEYKGNGNCVTATVHLPHA